jgi:hypothetical protein
MTLLSRTITNCAAARMATAVQRPITLLRRSRGVQQ